MRDLVKRASEVREEEGNVVFAKKATNFILGMPYREYREWKLPYHEKKRTDSEDRWETIQNHIEEEDLSAIDIGCASGFLTNKLNEEGVFAIGIDFRNKRLKHARKLSENNSGIGFIDFKINPENINSLPEMDVCLMLTVYHHWTNGYGPSKAEEMLVTMASKMDKIFFELPKDLDKNPHFETNRDLGSGSYVERHQRFLNQVLGDVDIEFLGEAEYPTSNHRTDLMFKIDCSGI